MAGGEMLFVPSIRTDRTAGAVGERSCGRRKDGWTVPRRERGSRLVVAAANDGGVSVARNELLAAIEDVGPDRGIFGMPTEQRKRLAELIELVEKENPQVSPTSVIEEHVAGTWRVVYTTLTILAARRSKLALGTSTKPGFVTLGDIYQSIHPQENQASNLVHFRIMGGIQGTFTVNASYSVVSDDRVDVTLIDSVLQPSRMEKLLGKNMSLLTEIFNPEGHLDITYVDHALRIGRDHKNQVFVLEKCSSPPTNISGD